MTLLQHLPRPRQKPLFKCKQSSQWEFALITVPDLLRKEVDLNGGTPTAVNKISSKSPHLIFFLVYFCGNETFVPVALRNFK